MSATVRIMDLFEKPIDRRIEEVIKVDQTDEDTVYQELTEYVVTQSIRDQYLKVLEPYQETPQKPHEGIGVWISGFFGSGKSSFAKNLGYILEGRRVKGYHATDLFLQQANDPRLAVVLKTINEKIPTKAVIFDVATDRGVKTGSERITEIMYKALLRELDYSDDLDLAELEIALEAAGELEEFEKRFQAKYGKPWREARRRTIFAFNQASTILHEMHPETYPAPDSWARSRPKVDITPNLFAQRTLELMSRRAPGRTLVFVVDEVGQYVGRSTDKMLDLQGVVQALGRVGKGRIWVMVTSQERLDEVVSNLDGTRVEYARLMDRFPIQVDLGPNDISEVTSRRVLTKKASLEGLLRDLYRQHEGALGMHTRLHGTSRRSELTQEQFVQLYPFLPYQIDLIIQIISGLRTQGGAGSHVGGSNRTLIKLAQQIIINPRVNLGEQPVGALVTLDMVYDLVEGNVAYEKRLEIADVIKNFGEHSWEARVAKAICLLQMVRDLPRTEANLAAVLYPRVGHPPVLPEVEAALERLQAAQKVRKGEQGWELLSVEGKRWETERQGIPFGDREAAVIRKAQAEEIFRNVRSYRHLNLRTFVPTLYVDGEKLGSRDGDLDLKLYLADEGPAYEERLAQGRDESRLNPNCVVWVAPVRESTLSLMKELHRSSEMVRRYGRESNLSKEQEKLLAEEKARQENLQREVRVRLQSDLLEGATYFRGVERSARMLGSSVDEVVHALLSTAVPEVFDKFALAAYPVKGGEAKALLTSTNLSGLPAVVYESGGMGLVVRRGGRYEINLDAPAAREVMDFIQQRHALGEPVTGRALEDHFTGGRYGWELDIIMLITAALFRGTAIEMTVQGQRIRTPSDPGALEPFTKVPHFRSASFAPRGDGLTLKDLTRAHQAYRELFGEEVELEEGALAAGIRKQLLEERERLLPLIRELSVMRLPGAVEVESLAQMLIGIASSPSDDAIRTFAQEALAIHSGLEQARQMREALNASARQTIEKARSVLQNAWPALKGRVGTDPEVAAAGERLQQNLAALTWYQRLPTIAQDTQYLAEEYLKRYRDAWNRRNAAYERAVEEVKSLPGFAALEPSVQQRLLQPLLIRIGEPRDGSAITEPRYSPTLDQLEADLLAVEPLKQQVKVRLEELTQEEPVVTVPVSRFFPTSIANPEELDEALVALKEYCLKLIQEGKRIIFIFK